MKLFSLGDIEPSPLPRSATFMFLGVAGGPIERLCYSPHYVNTERDHERDHQATLPQGRTAADGCKPRHSRDDRKRERSFSGLRPEKAGFCLPAEKGRGVGEWLLRD